MWRCAVEVVARGGGYGGAPLPQPQRQVFFCGPFRVSFCFCVVFTWRGSSAPPMAMGGQTVPHLQSYCFWRSTFPVHLLPMHSHIESISRIVLSFLIVRWNITSSLKRSRPDSRSHPGRADANLYLIKRWRSVSVISLIAS